mmetsp:Transcript_13968/g.46255  ORF Transcript_13968/g.46255 Transcript_13968/m.46255 type:complete len:223 (-) Transcript_13968:261-929(-)
MTFEAAPPAWNTVVLITTESSGSTRLDTMVCNAVTTAAPHTTTSTFLCGTAACPPAPVTVISYDPLPAMMVPPFVPTVPDGVSWYGQLCNAKAVEIFGCMVCNPASNMARAPAPPSSAGWNTKYTVPFNACSFRFKIFAAPNNMATCPSCPQACIKPVFWLRKCSGKFPTSVSSVNGSASMSARNKTTGAIPLPIIPTTPGAATSLCVIRMACSSRLITDEV